MKISLTGHAFAVVVILAIAATVFRVGTAPDRIRERMKTAQAVCLASGGEWVTLEGEPVCRKDAPAGLAR